MNTTDQLVLNRAALSGDARTMHHSSTAVMAIVGCLRRDDLSDFQRDGLLIALNIIAGDLSDRAVSIEEMLGEGGEL